MSTTATVRYTGDLRTTALHLQSKTEILTDAPVDNQGKGAAFSPTDLVATALASCMMTIMGIKANERQINLTGSTAEVTKVMSANPRRIAEILITFELPAGLTQRDRVLLEAAAHACPVGKSLHPETKQNIRFNYV